MYEVVKRGGSISISCQLDHFDKLVKPILLYDCEIWGFGNNRHFGKGTFESLQNYSSLKSYNAKLYDVWGSWSLSFRYRH